MNLRKIFLLAALVVACASAARAQQTPACTVKRDAAPELRGFRLGMTEAQVKTRVPAAQAVNRDPLGQGSLALQYQQLKDLDAAAYAGVGYITLLFIDDRLTSISVQYDQTVTWKSPEQFAERVSELLKLPKAWRPEQEQTQHGSTPFLSMSCDGFRLSVFPNFIRLIDDAHEATLARRRDEIEEKRRQTFKP